MVYDYIIVFMLAFLGVYFLTPLMIRFANKINFMDNPEARKMHLKAIPLLGGLAVFIGFTALLIYDVVIFPGKNFDQRLIGFYIGALIIVITGLIDDRMGMSPKVKMVGQLLCAITFIASNNLLTLLGPVWISVPIQIFWLIGLMNAFNFLDNMDGILSGMSGILAFGFFALAMFVTTPSLASDTRFIALLSLTFAGSVFGFLPHNFNPAKIFLGDTGSMFIGYFLGAVGILSGRLSAIRMSSNLYFLLPILLLSYAIFDISLVSYTRKRDGRHVMEGGKDHSTHRIGNATGSVKLTAIVVYIINIIIALVSVLVFSTKSHILLIVATAIFVGGFLLFGKKLDKIPVVISKNQLKTEKK